MTIFSYLQHYFLKPQMTVNTDKRGTEHVSDKEHQDDDWYFPQSAETLLNTDYRQELLTLLWQKMAVSKSVFNKHYLMPIHRYAELVQFFPASAAHHHAYPGGLLEHTLEVIK